jgi:hypothetical protein
VELRRDLNARELRSSGTRAGMTVVERIQLRQFHAFPAHLARHFRVDLAFDPLSLSAY